VIIDRLVELAIVLLEFAARAELLSDSQAGTATARPDFAYLGKGAAAGAEKLKQTMVSYDRNMNQFLDLAKDEMPEITRLKGPAITTPMKTHGCCRPVVWSCWTSRRLHGCGI
jgi:hypothetical protein